MKRNTDLGMPLYDRIILKRREAENLYKGSILKPDTAVEKSFIGDVVAVGHGRLIPQTGEIKPLLVRVGDVVRFTQHAGHEVKLGDETYLVIREEEVLIILPKG